MSTQADTDLHEQLVQDPWAATMVLCRGDLELWKLVTRIINHRATIMPAAQAFEVTQADLKEGRL